jgi:CRP-like cAMP-binding protein
MNRKDWEIYFDAVRKQNWETARNVLKKISAEEKNNPQVYLKLGDVYQKTGDSAQAIASYHRSALLLRKQGFNQKAVALYKIILRMAPDEEDAVKRTAQVMREIESEKTAPRKAGGPDRPSDPDENKAAARRPEGTAPAQREGPSAAGAEYGTIPETRTNAGVPKLFSGMSDEEFQRTLKEFEVRTYAPGKKVIEEGDSGDSMYLIGSGRAKVVAHLGGREVELAELGEGDLFGEVAFLTGRPRTAEVVALGPLRVFEIGRIDIERIIERNPEVLSRLEDFYERRAMDTVKKIRSRPKNS